MRRGHWPADRPRDRLWPIRPRMGDPVRIEPQLILQEVVKMGDVGKGRGFRCNGSPPDSTIPQHNPDIVGIVFISNHLLSSRYDRARTRTRADAMPVLLFHRVGALQSLANPHQEIFATY